MAACKQVNFSRGSGLKVSLLVSILVLSASSGVHGFFLEWGKDLEGPWCATRPGEDCCDGRDDYCAVPILGTECYCDIFCNATAHDCCPDYWRHCHGHHVPATTPRPTTLPPPRPTRDNLGKSACVSGVSRIFGPVFEYLSRRGFCFPFKSVFLNGGSNALRGRFETSGGSVGMWR